MTLPTPAPRIMVAACLVLLQSVVLYWPSPPDLPGAALIPFFDKVVHLGLFALPTAALVAAVRRPAVAVGAMVGQGLLSEAVQGAFIPGRGAEPLDLLADLLGVGVGVAVGRAARRPCNRWRISPVSPNRRVPRP